MIELILLIIFLLSFLYFEYRYNAKSYMSASFFMIATFLISATISLLAISDWHVTMHFNSVIIICTLILTFSIGEKFGSRIKTQLHYSKSNYHGQQIFEKRPIQINNVYSVIAILFMGGVTYFYFSYIMRISMLAGNSFGISRMFEYARYAMNSLQYDTNMGGLLGHSIIVSECLGYIYLYVIIYNYCNKYKVKFIYFIPCVLHLVHIGISTARLDYISYICSAVIMVALVNSKKNSNFGRINFKTLSYLFAGMFAVLLGFRVLGYLTGKSAVRNTWDDISIYAGSSIVGFDYFFNNRPVANNIFAKETLYNVYRLLNSLRITNVEQYSVALPFINNGYGFKTNIYTAFRRLIQDYGLLSTYFIMFFEGTFYGKWLEAQKKKRFTGLSTIIFAYMFYPVVYTFFEEKFILNFTAIRLLYHFIYFYVLYRIFIKSRQW